MTGTKKIVRRQTKAHVHSLPKDLHPVLARVYAARNVLNADELDCSLQRLHHPRQLKGIDPAVELLANVIQSDKHIVVVADFDADGATSCALAIRALRAMGAKRVGYVVPNRFEFGYGLTPEIVRLAAQHRPDLLITVDNGIASVEGVKTAHEQDMAVLITDHHLPGETIPPADAIVNPNQGDDRFPSKCLAGVGVIFYVMLALRAYLREQNWFEQASIVEPNLARLLDLVAVGTVADLVPLDRNNRVLVVQGLARINRGGACAGIQALLKVAGSKGRDVTTTDLGFRVGPRLNAAGRLEDMSLGIECLLTDKTQAAEEMARQLDVLNRERRAIEADMQRQANEAIDALHLESRRLPKGICLFDPNWHQGIIGLVASRIKDRVHRPVIAFAPANETELKGSARSIPGLHIRDALDAVATRHPDLLTRFGGHAMAAGLSLEHQHFKRFCDAFDEEVSHQLSDDDLEGKILTDGELVNEELTVELASLLRSAGPWGQDFPEPVFDGQFEIVSKRVVGDRHLKLALRYPGQNKVVEAIGFHLASSGTAPDWPRTHAAYKLDVNDYQGYQTLQLVIEHMEPVW
ncbi:MAG: single-stranded-DNA-specific exonuclease RecJ [Acidiferrobacterales bacterium]